MAETQTRISSTSARTNTSSHSIELEENGSMLLPSEGPRISHGKGIVMSQVKDEKKVVAQHATAVKSECTTNTFDGKIISVTGRKLVMKNNEGKEYSHTLATDAKVTCDGTTCKAEELKAGRKIRVTTKKEDSSVATGIEALNKNAEFAQCG